MRSTTHGRSTAASRGDHLGTKFQAIVEHARQRIESGTWAPDARLPSENELAARFGVSRMTAKRALDQLALEGLIVRRQGAGSFTARNDVRSSFLVIRSIADEVAESGRAYASVVLRQCPVTATRSVADALEIKPRTRVFHSLIVHLANSRPVQLEYRYVRPDTVPGYLEADLAHETPNQYLQRCHPLVRASQEVGAALPTPRECRALEIEPDEPCLLITRVTASHAGLVSYARMLCPTSRYRLSGQLHYSSRLPA